MLWAILIATIYGLFSKRYKRLRRYEKDGQKKSFTKVKVDRVEFVGGGKTETNTLPNGFEAIDDDELPF